MSGSGSNNNGGLSISPKGKIGARINRKVVAGVAAFLGVIFLLSLSQGLSTPEEKASTTERSVAKPDASVPGTIFAQPSSYSDLKKAEEEAAKVEEGGAIESPERIGPASNQEEAIEQAEVAANLEALKEEDQANRSGIILLQGQAIEGGQQPAGIGDIASGLLQEKVSTGNPILDAQAKLLSQLTQEGVSKGASNGQMQKLAFQKQGQALGDEQGQNAGNTIYLDSALQNPVSPYEVAAGSIIPANLITGINTDLPGEIVGQVRENVYDTATGNHLLIPQGTRLVGSYDSIISYGQERALLIWNTMIFPNGATLSLAGMNGTDLSGFSGVGDYVDHHYGRLVGGVLLSSLLSIGVTASQEDTSTFRRPIEQRVGDDVGGALAGEGNKIAEKNMNVQPTIRVRPGFSFNVFVHKNIVLKPYQG